MNGKFASILADSGVGKSTLAYYLVQNGALFGCDDVVPLRNVGGRIIATPSASLYPKLHRDTAVRSGLNIGDLIRAIDTGPPEEEYWVPLRMHQRIVEPSPLSALFVLVPRSEDTMAPETDGVRVEVQASEVSFQTILRHLQGVWVVGKVLSKQRLEAWAKVLANEVPLYLLHYSRCAEALPQLQNAILIAMEQNVKPLISLQTLGDKM